MNPAERADLSGNHSALEPAGPAADRVEDLFWANIGVLGAVWVLVMAFALIAVLRRRMRPSETPERVLPRDEPSERRMHRAIAVASVVTLLTLVGLLVSSVAVGKSISELKRPDALEIRVTAQQWWWRVEYPNASPDQSVTSANEIHVPVGRPIEIVLTASDVIHSFWVPALSGKLDLIPGRKNELHLSVERAGIYGGQCAEFCGHGHAKMGLLVIAQPPAEFDAWLAASRKPSAPPSGRLAQEGQQVFLSAGCPMCHSILGTPAGASVAPDLTHFASRRSIGAASVPNVRGHLAGWILDPQQIKPGSHMPPNAMHGADLQALLAYLEQLK